mgnify:CR=1 FL=1
MAWDNEKKKVKTAVAVAYEPGDKAPKILASGRGEVAEKIIAKAKENDVPFYKDNKLAETLCAGNQRRSDFCPMPFCRPQLSMQRPLSSDSVLRSHPPTYR